ncbi:MAG TPA: Rieske 2Fe-2S domain-containing protein [Stellaceae bacterium]|jgi:3-hydroxyanthranilate 3,4-dioxygenase|nr:Rieske 2Fe-2S domain-containing protein [Stellaceae bacterium]
MRRKNRFETYKEAADRGNYDEFPMLELGIDPQLHLSRNTVAQPFFLICEQDTILAQMSGTARIEFRNSPANYFNMALGDFVYVPGGTPHRLVPQTESVHLRYKAAQPGLEAVAWYKGDEEVARVTWDCAKELPQEAYLRACRAFNADASLRKGLPAIDLTPFQWDKIGAEVKEAESFEAEHAHKKPAGQDPNALQRVAPNTIAPPSDERVPLKVNCYDYARTATAALSPMFPYFAPGCIVPCIALQDPGARGEMGYFVHYNTVQEVNLCVGSSNTFRVPGGVSVGPTTHPVGQKPDQAEHSSMFYMGVITQRQAVGVPQNEAMIFHCDKCGAELLRRDYGADEFPDRLDGPTDPQIIGLPTISQSSAAAEAYNASDAARTCKSCGHVSKPFPTGYWGWDHYRRRTAIAVTSRKIMGEVAAQDAQRNGDTAASVAEAVATKAADTGTLRFQPAAKASEIADGEMKEVVIGAKHIAIYNLGGRYHATEAYCTHGHALLTEGYIDGAIVECPMHGGTFDIASGKPTGAPCTTPLATYPVHVDGDTIAIGLGDAA